MVISSASYKYVTTELLLLPCPERRPFCRLHCDKSVVVFCFIEIDGRLCESNGEYICVVWTQLSIICYRSWDEGITQGYNISIFQLWKGCHWWFVGLPLLLYYSKDRFPLIKDSYQSFPLSWFRKTRLYSL